MTPSKGNIYVYRVDTYLGDDSKHYLKEMLKMNVLGGVMDISIMTYEPSEMLEGSTIQKYLVVGINAFVNIYSLVDAEISHNYTI
jgi:NADH:ubiquinone oxidoreductase subunit F (NADH-binding)